jgi:hypothetical protein
LGNLLVTSPDEQFNMPQLRQHSLHPTLRYRATMLDAVSALRGLLTVLSKIFPVKQYTVCALRLCAVHAADLPKTLPRTPLAIERMKCVTKQC